MARDSGVGAVPAVVVFGARAAAVAARAVAQIEIGVRVGGFEVYRHRRVGGKGELVELRIGAVPREGFAAFGESAGHGCVPAERSDRGRIDRARRDEVEREREIPREGGRQKQGGRLNRPDVSDVGCGEGVDESGVLAGSGVVVLGVMTGGVRRVDGGDGRARHGVGYDAHPVPYRQERVHVAVVGGHVERERPRRQDFERVILGVSGVGGEESGFGVRGGAGCADVEVAANGSVRAELAGVVLLALVEREYGEGVSAGFGGVGGSGFDGVAAGGQVGEYLRVRPVAGIVVFGWDGEARGDSRRREDLPDRLIARPQIEIRVGGGGAVRVREVDEVVARRGRVEAVVSRMAARARGGYAGSRPRPGRFVFGDSSGRGVVGGGDAADSTRGGGGVADAERERAGLIDGGGGRFNRISPGVELRGQVGAVVVRDNRAGIDRAGADVDIRGDGRDGRDELDVEFRAGGDGERVELRPSIGAVDGVAAGDPLPGGCRAVRVHRAERYGGAGGGRLVRNRRNERRHANDAVPLGKRAQQIGGDVGFEPVVSGVVYRDAVGFQERLGVRDVAVGVNRDGDGVALAKGGGADGVENGGFAERDAFGDGVEGCFEVGEGLRRLARAEDGGVEVFDRDFGRLGVRGRGRPAAGVGDDVPAVDGLTAVGIGDGVRGRIRERRAAKGDQREEAGRDEYFQNAAKRRHIFAPRDMLNRAETRSPRPPPALAQAREKMISRGNHTRSGGGWQYGLG